jgi:hypothetical protein
MNTFLSILCTLLLGGALFAAAHVWLALRGAEVFDGKVVGIDTSIDSTGDGGSRRHAPIVQYVDRNGNARTFTAAVAAFNVDLGAKVYVARRADNGKEKLIALGELFMAPLALALFGCILLLLVFPLTASSATARVVLKLLLAI